MTTSDLTHVTWTQVSYSGAQGECLEVAVPAKAMVHARDSKNPHGPALHFTRDDWRTSSRRHPPRVPRNHPDPCQSRPRFTLPEPGTLACPARPWPRTAPNGKRLHRGRGAGADLPHGHV